MSHATNYLPGDLIFADVHIDPLDIVVIGTAGDTTKAAQKGDPVTRICIVLAAGVNDVTVTYTATFKDSTVLPTDLDADMWYPFTPATQGTGPFNNPLQAMINNKPQWACVRKRQIIPLTAIKRKLAEKLPNTTVTSLTGAMLA